MTSVPAQESAPPTTPAPPRADPAPPAPALDRPAGTPVDRPAAPGRTAVDPAMRLVTPRIVAATARRVLAQLHGDRRTVGMLIVVPSLLLVLIHEMLDSKRAFDTTGLYLLGIFPFTMMFLVTSVAMLRERTSGTLERLLTTPMSKLDLLLGYGLAFATAATAQALVTSAVAYLVLGLYTPGAAVAVIVIAIASAVLGMALGLLGSAFATSEFQAVQFMPAVVMPQVLLGGLFVPREQMATWLEKVSDALPLTYVLEALKEVSETGLMTAALLGNTAVVVGAAMVALALAASTLRRRAGELSRPAQLAVRAVPFVALALSVTLTVGYLIDAHRYVRTDNAQIDADRIPIVAPVDGTLSQWRATLGTELRRNEAIGRIQLGHGQVQAERVLRAPADGTVVLEKVVEGAYVTAGSELAVGYDLTEVYVTARVDETDIEGVQPGHQVDITVDGQPGVTFAGFVREIRGASAATFAANPRDNATGSFQKLTQVIPVKIAILDRQDRTLVPGMNVSVAIHRS
jgi:ABC transporter DrrB family efflux protein